MTYRLFYSPGACSLAPHIVLEEIGVPFELELVSSRGEREGAMTATAEWRAMNPKARIPALSGVPGSMGGTPRLLAEVTAILAYLAMEHPHSRLLPTSPAPLARCLERMNWLSANVHAISYGQIWRAQRYSVDERGLEAIREKGRSNLREQYTYIDKLLADGRRWAIPQGYSIVDPYCWSSIVGVGASDSI